VETSITQDGAGRRLSSRLYVKGSLGQVAVTLVVSVVLYASFATCFCRLALWLLFARSGGVVGTLTTNTLPGSLGRDLFSSGLWDDLAPQTTRAKVVHSGSV
jgi:hypothetical protein